MRKIIEKQIKIGQVDIGAIELDLSSRDEIPQLLLGLQAIYCDREVRQRVFAILESIIPRHINTGNGRPGMELWKILVLGTLRLNCNWDYDKVHEIANNHHTVRMFLDHTKEDLDQRYALQTIKDNLSLLTPEVLDQISTLVVNKGRKLCGTETQPQKGRCDSFVVETDVHYPTDINLLWDAVRKVIQLTARECAVVGISEWRQSDYILRKIKKAFNKARKIKQSKSKDASRQQLVIAAHQAYVSTAKHYIERAHQTLSILNELGLGNVAQLMLIEHFIAHAERQIDQILRRVVDEQTIPHHEKVFSIFEPHTEWISKGKAGVSQELGLRVCVLDDQDGFILHHQVMERQTDDQVAVLMVAAAKRKFRMLKSCSFDKGFHSPTNQKKLKSLLQLVVLPRKGGLSQQTWAIEHSESFIESRRKHAAVESTIAALENHGLDRCPDHGLYGFKRYIALSILARNLQILGKMVQQKKLKRLRRCQGPPQIKAAA